MLVFALLLYTATINGLNTIRFAQNTAAFPAKTCPKRSPPGSEPAARAPAGGGRTGSRCVSLMDEWSPIAFVGRNFRTENTATYGRAALVPPGGAIVVLFQQPGDPTSLTPPYARQAGSPLVLDDGTRITIWRVTPGDLRIDHPADIPSDINVSFVGWTLGGDLAPGAASRSILSGGIDGLHPERGIWSFLAVAHVLDTTGTQIAEDQGNAVSTLTWAVGDTMIQRLNLTIPADAAGPLALDVSLFDPVRVRDDGTPGVNAIFHVTDGEENTYTAEILIEPQQ